MNTTSNPSAPYAPPLAPRRRAKTPRSDGAGPRRSHAGLRREVTELFKGAILDAAERVFGTRGFAEAKMSDIAREAGLAAGTLYNYFDSKEAIFRALMDLRSRELLAEMKLLAAAPGSVRERLVALLRGTFQYLERHAAMFGLFLQSAPGTALALHRVCGPGVERSRDQFLRLFEDAFRGAIADGLIAPGHRPEDLALLVTGGHHAFVRAWLRGGRRGHLAGRAEYVVRALLDGVGVRP